MHRKKLTPQQAKAMLMADGMDFQQDFHALGSSAVQALADVAKLAGYRKSKNAPGSTVRMFYQYLSRVEPVERGAGQLTPAERRAYQTRAKKKTLAHSTKKSPAQLDREIAAALAARSGASNPFEEAKAERDLLEKEANAASEALQVFPRGAMGLTPDAVTATPEYQAAKARFQKAFARQREFNAVFTKRFVKELRAERAKRYGSR